MRLTTSNTGWGGMREEMKIERTLFSIEERIVRQDNC
jgi:hypothetical protein